MTIPAFFLGTIIALLFGALFHLVRGGSGKRLLAYLFLGWLGFWAGHIIGNIISFTFFSLGPIRTGMATLGSLAFLFLGQWLSMSEAAPEK